jgi:hypothetical protein
MDAEVSQKEFVATPSQKEIVGLGNYIYRAYVFVKKITLQSHVIVRTDLTFHSSS